MLKTINTTDNSPTIFPTNALPTYQTRSPIGQPTVSSAPSPNPTTSPTLVPSFKPTIEPSSAPSEMPTYQPTLIPTLLPTSLPSLEPTRVPSNTPSGAPTFQPTVSPTPIPTTFPTAQPTSLPSTAPTVEPTSMPSFKPTTIPSVIPSKIPTFQPTLIPTSTPTALPTVHPTASPSFLPSVTPTFFPTSDPTSLPTGTPTQPRVLNQNIDYHFGTQGTVLSTGFSVLGTYIFYQFVLRILDKWGYNYRLVTKNSEQLEDNEIGLYLKGDRLMAVHKQKEYEIEISTGNNYKNGIDIKLYKLLVNQLKQEEHVYYLFDNIRYVFTEQDASSLRENEFGIRYNPYAYSCVISFFGLTGGVLEVVYKDTTMSDAKIVLGIGDGGTEMTYHFYKSVIGEYKQLSSSLLLVSEQNQLRDFLLTNQHISYGTFCGIPSYIDLGCIQGFLYYIVYDLFKAIKNHHDNSRKDVRLTKTSCEFINHLIELKIQPETLQTSSTESPIYDGMQLQVIENNRNNDVSSSKNDMESQSFNNHRPSSMLLCIDIMDSKHIILQNEELTKFANYLINFIIKESPKDFYLLLTSIQSKITTVLVEDIPRESQTAIICENPTPAYNTQFTSSNGVMLTLLTAKQILYNLPLLHYLAQNSITILATILLCQIRWITKSY